MTFTSNACRVGKGHASSFIDELCTCIVHVHSFFMVSQEKDLGNSLHTECNHGNKQPIQEADSINLITTVFC